MASARQYTSCFCCSTSTARCWSAARASTRPRCTGRCTRSTASGRARVRRRGGSWVAQQPGAGSRASRPPGAPTWRSPGRSCWAAASRLIASTSAPRTSARRCFEEYCRRCPGSLEDRVVPGMADLLDSLAQRPGVILALVTGNLEPIARLKLARAGIGKYFPTGQGGFGSDSEDRTRPAPDRPPPRRPGARRGGRRTCSGRLSPLAHADHRRHAPRHRVRPRRRTSLHRGHHRAVQRRAAAPAPTRSPPTSRAARAARRRAPSSLA